MPNTLAALGPAQFVDAVMVYGLLLVAVWAAAM
jgi:hypothetical protein